MNSNTLDLNKKRILVTGGNGYIGQFLIPELKDKGAKVIHFRSREYDLRKEEEVKRLFESVKPEVVIHLAVDCGKFKYKLENPGSMFYNNVMMNTLIQEYARKNNIEKFVGMGTSAEYPTGLEAPLKEENIMNGLPEEFNLSYGLSKRMMLTQSQTYKNQYNFNSIHLVPVNLYGPKYSTSEKDIRIIPILIDKFVDAKFKNEDVELSGTGEDLREFIYIKDCVDAIVLATEKYNLINPLNIGTGQEVKLNDLAEKVRDTVDELVPIYFPYNYPKTKSKIIWKDKINNKNPKSMVLDTTQIGKEINWKANTSLEEGLKKTIGWYLEYNKYCSGL